MHYVSYKIAGYNLFGIGIAWVFANLPMIWAVIILLAVAGAVEVAWQGYFNLLRSILYPSVIALSMGVSYGVFVPNTLYFSNHTCSVETVKELESIEAACYFIIVKERNNGC